MLRMCIRYFSSRFTNRWIIICTPDETVQLLMKYSLTPVILPSCSCLRLFANYPSSNTATKLVHPPVTIVTNPFQRCSVDSIRECFPLHSIANEARIEREQKG